MEDPEHRWMYNSKMNLKEEGWGASGLIWLRIVTGGGALVNAVMNLRVP